MVIIYLILPFWKKKNPPLVFLFIFLLGEGKKYPFALGSEG